MAGGQGTWLGRHLTRIWFRFFRGQGHPLLIVIPSIVVDVELDILQPTTQRPRARPAGLVHERYADSLVDHYTGRKVSSPLPYNIRS